MPKINGFEMLELIEQPPAVIFTTAYDEFAIRAFEANALIISGSHSLRSDSTAP
jgi:two-component system LytT family response regulator